MKLIRNKLLEVIKNQVYALGYSDGIATKLQTIDVTKPHIVTINAPTPDIFNEIVEQLNKKVKSGVNNRIYVNGDILSIEQQNEKNT